MDPFSKKKMTERAIAVLIILNLITLTALWLTVFRRPPGGPPSRGEEGGREAQPFLIRELGLTQSQAKEFDDIKNRFLASVGPVLEEIQRLKEAALSEMFKPRPDRGKIEALASEIGSKRSEEEKLLLFHFLDMVDACQPDQKNKFQSVIREFMMMIGALGPSRPADERPAPEGRPDDRRPRKRS